MMNMKIGAEVAGLYGAHRKHARIRVFLVSWLLLVALPGFVLAAEDEVEEKTPEPDTAGETPAEEGEVTLDPAADEKTKSDTPSADSVPVADEPAKSDQEDTSRVVTKEAVPPSPSTSTQQALRRALDTVSELQLLLASSHEGDGPVRGHEELAELRRSLEDALVEVTRLEQQQTLRQWLEGEGLRAALAEVEGERSQAKAEAAREAAEVAEVEGAESEPVAVDSARLRAVKRAIEDAPFKEGKMQVLTEQLRDAQVSSEQVGELIQLFAFSRDKVETLVFLYPRLVDPDHFDELLSTLKFASDRMAVRQRLGLSGS